MKKGFTLVELLGVVVLIALLGLLVVPIVDRAIRNSKETAYEEQVNRLIEATKNWAAKYSDDLPKDTITASYVGINDLQLEGLISNEDVIDPRDNKKMSGCIKITYEPVFTRYNYNYYEDSCEILREKG